MTNPTFMRVTLAHHWIITMRGGEKVLEQFCRMFPGAPIETLIAASPAPSPIIGRHPIRQTLLEHLPWGRTHYRHFLPVLPLILKTRRVDADLLLSSDASLIKGIGKKPDTRHACYCYSPPRYLWDVQGDYLDSLPWAMAVALKACTTCLRAFDRRSARKVDLFIAISDFVAERIRVAYGRDSEVVYPPVDVEGFVPGGQRDDFYLVVSALTPYKRIDLAVRAFNTMNLPLVIIGDGPERTRLEAMASSNVIFLGAQPFGVLRDHYQRCKAFIFPGVEDFGITPLEAQAAGRPVVALGRGGALETVVDGGTGIFFSEQSEISLIDAVLRMEQRVDEFNPETCRRNALRFRPEVFRSRMREVLTRAFPHLFNGYSWPEDNSEPLNTLVSCD